MNIYQLIQQQRVEKQRKLSNFVFETIKAFQENCVLKNPNSSTYEKTHAGIEICKYIDKRIHKEH